MSIETDVQVDFRDLLLDLNNPRVPGRKFSSQEEALDYLVKHAEVLELVKSIGKSGWMDYEPLVVEQPTREVIEGNRRLAALRLLDDDSLWRKYYPRTKIDDVRDHDVPDRVRVRYVQKRSEARDFIGFKHINGAFKWDALAKAKYAAEWLDDPDDDATIEQISARLGDNNSTVSRMINGYRVLVQAKMNGFDESAIYKPGSFNFSHLYTGISRPAMREYLGIEVVPSDTLPVDPVPDLRTEQLMEVMLWLYGDKNISPVVLRQNPDLGRLVTVLADARGIEILQNTGSLDQAYDRVEDKAAALSKRLDKVASDSYDLLRLVPNYKRDNDDAWEKVDELFKNVRTVRSSMSSIREGEADE